MSDLMAMAATLSEARDDAPDLPVERWHPAHCGEMDMVIKVDGTWVHEGTPIGRPQLVRLFSRILRKDPDGYVLVTPAEKISIVVEDVPFVGVTLDADGDDLVVRTNVGDRVRIDGDHPLTMRKGPGGADLPYVRVRHGLEARLSRSAWFELVGLADLDETETMFVESGGVRFLLGQGEAA